MRDALKKRLASLTPRQRDIYEFVREKILNRGYGPTVREIGTHFGIRSPNGVMCHLKALQKKGFIIRESRMSRAIQLTERPQRLTSLRLGGHISADQPQLFDSENERIDFAGVFGGGHNVAYRVDDESLVGERIFPGDYLVVREEDYYRDGDKVLVIAEGKPMIRRHYQEDSRVRLEPLTPTRGPVYFEDAKILGTVVAVVRQF